MLPRKAAQLAGGDLLGAPVVRSSRLWLLKTREASMSDTRPYGAMASRSPAGSSTDSSGGAASARSDNNIVQSCSRVGQWWDNALSENWFSTLKEEFVHRFVLPTRGGGGFGSVAVVDVDRFG